MSLSTRRGALPRITLSDPTNINQSAGGLSNPDNWYLRSVMDHLEESKGHEYALRADGEYDFHSNWLNSLKFGALVTPTASSWCSGARITGRTSPTPGRTAATRASRTLIGTSTASPAEPATAPARCSTAIRPASTPCSRSESKFFGGNLGSFPFVPFSFLDAHKADLFSQRADRRRHVHSDLPAQWPISAVRRRRNAEQLLHARRSRQCRREDQGRPTRC